MQYSSSGSSKKEPLLHFLASTKELAADFAMDASVHCNSGFAKVNIVADKDC